MNLFTRMAEILEDCEGSTHLQYIEKLLEAICVFAESGFFESDNVRDAALDELIQYLESKKSKPKDNGHA